MINKEVILWSCKEVRKSYKELALINNELKKLFDFQFPFVKPKSTTWYLSNKDIQLRNRILRTPLLPYDVIGAENRFKQVYLRHIGVLEYFKY